MTAPHITLDSRPIASAGAFFNGPIAYRRGSRDVAFGGSYENLAQHRVRFGMPAHVDQSLADEVIDTIEAVGLTGRGGAHIPAAWKLRAARQSPPGGTVVVNGAEGEPGSAKDSALLQLRPHLVLDGAEYIAELIGARDIVLWIHASSRGTEQHLREAIRERRETGALHRPIRILLAPDGYVSGESSAVIRAINGGPALPQHSKDRVRPWGSGPAVLVHNTETCARMGLYALGCDPVATSLVTVSELNQSLEFDQRIVFEVTETTTFRDVVTWSDVDEPVAVLLGGFGGTWIAWSDVADLAINPTSLAQNELSLGAGAIQLLPKNVQGLTVTAAIVDYMAGQSARQCGPCMFGLPALSKEMNKVARGKKSKRIDQLAEVVANRGACRHPDGTLRMMLTGLEVFRR